MRSRGWRSVVVTAPAPIPATNWSTGKLHVGGLVTSTVVPVAAAAAGEVILMRSRRRRRRRSGQNFLSSKHINNSKKV